MQGNLVQIHVVPYQNASKVTSLPQMASDYLCEVNCAPVRIDDDRREAINSSIEILW